jgi:hypothetical protein
MTERAAVQTSWGPADVKQQLLDRMHQEGAQWDTLLAEVGQERMEIPGATGEWTFKDIVVHLTAWWRREVGRLEAVRRGERPVPHPDQRDVQVINQWTYHTNRDRPLSDVLRDAQAVWQQFEAALQATPERDLAQPGRFDWLDGQALGPRIVEDFLMHLHEEHEPLIREWLTGLRRQ